MWKLKEDMNVFRKYETCKFTMLEFQRNY